MKCFREWGTIATPQATIDILYADSEGNYVNPAPTAKIRGYVIPPRGQSSSIHNRLPTRYKEGNFSKGDKSSISNLLKGPKCGGIYFYREGRSIAFGANNKDTDSNDGWYELIDTLMQDNDKNRDRGRNRL